MTDQDMDALVDNIVNSMSSAAVHQTQLLPSGMKASH